MSEMFAYRIQQINDNGQAVQITLVEDVQTEPLSQKQLMEVQRGLIKPVGLQMIF